MRKYQHRYPLKRRQKYGLLKTMENQPMTPDEAWNFSVRGEWAQNLALYSKKLLKLYSFFIDSKERGECLDAYDGCLGYDHNGGFFTTLAGMYSQRGYLKAYNGLIKGALQDFGQAITIGIEDQGFLYNERGCIFAYIGRTKQALKDFNSAIDLDSDAMAYANMAVYYLHIREYDLAQSYCAKSLCNSDQEYNVLSQIYCTRGLCYEEQGLFNDALNDYNLAIKAGKDNGYVDGENYFRRGCFYEKMRCDEKALRDYEEAAADEETDLPYPSLYCAMFYEKSGQAEQAVKFYEKAIALEIDRPYAYLHCATLYDELGQHEKVQCVYEKAREVGVVIPDSLFYRAMLMQAGNCEKQVYVTKQFRKYMI